MVPPPNRLCIFALVNRVLVIVAYRMSDDCSPTSDYMHVAPQHAWVYVHMHLYAWMQWMYGSVDVWMYGRMDGWMYGRLEVEVWLYGRIDVWMEVWMHNVYVDNTTMVISTMTTTHAQCGLLVGTCCLFNTS